MDASTTTKSGYLQPAAIGGVFMGVLSALPFISILNACCCLWVVSGGLLAAYFLQQNRQTPVPPADGALVGLLAGAIGVLIATALSIPIDFLIGPMQRELVRRIVENAGPMPPEAQQMLDAFSEPNQAGVVSQIIFRTIGAVVFLFVGSIVSMLGGLLGSVIFSRGARPLPSDSPAS